MRVVINGDPREVPSPITLAGLLAHLGLDPRMVVVEHNRAIVRRVALAEVRGGGRGCGGAGAFRGGRLTNWGAGGRGAEGR